MGSKLLFFDIDGTIWDYVNMIPDSAKEAFRLCKENGHKIFINSGRAKGYIRHEGLLGIGFDGIVSGCGTFVEYNGEVVFSHLLEPKKLARDLETLNGYGFRSILEGTDTLYLHYPEWEGDVYFNKLYRDLGDDILEIRDNWGKWDSICKFSSDTTGGDMEAGLKAVEDDYMFMVHNETVVEVVPKGFGKWKGIEFLCEYLGVKREDTFAFGDSSNDRDMLEYAGTSVAMGNGTDEIKAIADLVTAPLRKDGIYLACKELGLI